MSTFKDRKLILFDFDGVIVDSMQINLDINNHVFNRGIHIDEYRKMFLGNVYAIIDRDHKEIANHEIQEKYADEYQKRVLEIAPIAQIDEMLELTARNRPAFIVTSSREKDVELYLKKHDLLQYFNEIHGKETHRSKVYKFKKILADGKYRAEETVFITDTVGDIVEADEVGIDSVAVTWGFHPENWIKDSPHHTMVNTIEELTSLFR